MSTRSRRFIQCDVFSPVPTKGNALAVVLDADGLSDAQMQGFARWTNLAETTFLLPPEAQDADYKVRIFTPQREMPFAGHPTLGSCMAWLDAGGTPKTPGRALQECGVGLVPIDLTGECPAFVAPATRVAPMGDAERARIMQRLGLGADQVLATVELQNGPVWQVLELTSAEAVLAVDSSRVKWPEFKAIGLLGKQIAGAETDFEIRMLAPSSGMSEDPITGSLIGAVACWFQRTGRLDKRLLLSQGTTIDRMGRVSVESSPDGAIVVGGQVHIIVKGDLWL